MANEGGGKSGSMMSREYRKGNWTVQETMVLTEAKKMDEERRMKRSSSSSISIGGDHHQISSPINNNKQGELRWKWVEDYCWRNGCLRSQNQCNDKWDNLMRDFKKVRDYERRRSGLGGDGVEPEGGFNKSYWNMEKHERKDKNLPSNMLLQVYEALVDVVERRSLGPNPKMPTTITTITAPSSTISIVNPPPPPPLLLQHPLSALPPPPPPPPQPLVPPPSEAAAPPHSRPLPTTTVDSDTSEEEHSDSPVAKRRRRTKRGGEGTTTSIGNTNNDVICSAISKGARVIAEAIQACEERQETRHKELLSLHHRLLQIQESKTDITRQGINAVADSINKLANSIQAFAAAASHQNPNQSTPPPP